MPMIRGRYYMNPAMGEAMEEARARSEGHGMEPAEGAHGGGDGQHSGNAPGAASYGHDGAPGKVHRVEIEHAEGGFIARLHRHPGPGSAPESAHAPLMAENGGHAPNYEAHSAPGMPAHHGAETPAPEVHVFTNHNDLADFLRSEFGKHA